MSHAHGFRAHGGPSGQTAGGLHIWSLAWPYRSHTPAAWPGSDYGIRAPDPDETALSWAEVEHALAQLHRRGHLEH